jgi:6-phosphofructokinase 1
MGATATERIACNEFGVLVGLIKSEMVTTPLVEVVGKRKMLDPYLLNLAGILAQ